VCIRVPGIFQERLIATKVGREKLKEWQHDYNNHRPQGSGVYLSPCEFVKKGQADS
jgi:transposase InsO family protein